ncbi:MAG: hypothetical protein ACOYLQ_15730 [Hyphomicrobiaceae bacterium]
MLRLLIGVLLLVLAAPFLGFAGGIDVRSVADWQAVAQKWALPSVAENERCIALLSGGFLVVLAVLRLLTPGPRSLPTA